MHNLGMRWGLRWLEIWSLDIFSLFLDNVFFSLAIKLRQIFMLLFTYLMGLVSIAESASMGPEVCAKVVFSFQRRNLLMRQGMRQ